MARSRKRCASSERRCRLARQTGLPTVVSVTEEGVSGGQNWTRVYATKERLPAGHPFDEAIFGADGA